jgi:hypothetical protein
MKRKRYTEEKIISILKEADAGSAVKDSRLEKVLSANTENRKLFMPSSLRSRRQSHSMLPPDPAPR